MCCVNEACNAAELFPFPPFTAALALTPLINVKNEF
jgi:hypothetical protein